MSGRLGGPLATLARAERHIQDVQARVQGFLGTNPHRTGARREPETRRLGYDPVSVGSVGVAVVADAGAVREWRAARDRVRTIKRAPLVERITSGGRP